MTDPIAAAPGGRDLVRILAQNPGPMTLAGTNTYVVARDPAWVIDPGPDDEAHAERIRAEAERRGGIGGVLLTHSHADHTAGAERLGAAVLWGEAGEGDETGLASAADDPLPHALPGTPNRREPPERVEGTPFAVHPTPGHAADHACFEWGDVLFCGDLVLGEGSTIVPSRELGGSLGDYMRSLESIRELDVALLAPGHGPWITEPHERIDGYLEHRREREQRLLAALGSGERSRAALLDAAWSDVPLPLRPAAAVAMQAHLEKLEDEGLVRPSELTD